MHWEVLINLTFIDDNPYNWKLEKMIKSNHILKAYFSKIREKVTLLMKLYKIHLGQTHNQIVFELEKSIQ